MKVSFDRSYREKDFRQIFSFRYRQTAEAVVQEVLLSENCPYDAEVDIHLVTAEEIRSLNRERRCIDRTTDVLSFPMTQYERPADFTVPAEEKADAFDPENGLLMLGDIVISVPKVKEQAAAYGHSAKREFAFLVAHSMLHLIGYDHMTDAEAKVMTAKQEAVLEALHILRREA